METVSQTRDELDKRNEVALEALIDKDSLPFILSALVNVCYDKAAHLRENWQDEASATYWDSAGDALYRVMDDCR